MNNDLISRRALLAEIKRIGGYLGNVWQTAGVVSLVRTIPSVDPEEVIKGLPYVKEALEMAKQTVVTVRHGRWIFKDDDGAYPWTTKAICSECKEVIAWNRTLALESNQIEFAEENHYCLNCGAKMDGGGGDDQA